MFVAALTTGTAPAATPGLTTISVPHPAAFAAPLPLFQVDAHPRQWKISLSMATSPPLGAVPKRERKNAP